MNNGYDVNQALQAIFQMKNMGRNPQQLLQMLMQQHPQLGQMLTQFQNMMNGRNPDEFITQIARQNGLNDQSISTIRQILK